MDEKEREARIRAIAEASLREAKYQSRVTCDAPIAAPEATEVVQAQDAATAPEKAAAQTEADAVNGVALCSTHWFVLEKIRQLSKKHSYCYASNSYIASLVHLSRSRVAHIISDLCRAGMVFRHVQYDQENPKLVIRRDLVPVPEKIYKQLGQETLEQAGALGIAFAALKKFFEGLVKKTASLQQIRRIFFNAGRNGVPKTQIIEMLRHPEWTADYLEEKIAILTAHVGTMDPTRFLWAALWKDYQPGNRARHAAKKAAASVKAQAGMVSYDPRPVTKTYAPDPQKTAESRKALFRQWLKKGSPLLKKMEAYADANFPHAPQPTTT